MTAIAEHVHTDHSNALAPSDDAPPVPLIFTDSAANKVKELVDEEGNPDLKLRVFVQGGGCSGFQYGFTFDESYQRRRHRDETRAGVTTADRFNELCNTLLALRSTIQGRSEWRAVRDQEPERDDDLRLRFELLGLTLSA